MCHCSQPEPLILPRVGGIGSRRWISSGETIAGRDVDMRGLRWQAGTKSCQFITDVGVLTKPEDQTELRVEVNSSLN